MKSANPHVLVARQDNVGDVLLAGPAVRAVAANARRVTFLCGPSGRSAAELLPEVDDVIVHAAPWIEADPDPIDADTVSAVVADVAARQIDQAVILTSFHQSALPLALLLRLAGVTTVAAVSDDYPGALLDIRHHVPDDMHEVERALSTVATLGHRLPAGDDGRLAVRPEVMTVPSPVAGFEPYVVVHPGASVPARAWGPAPTAELVSALCAGGRRVVVTGGPGEQDLVARVAGSRGDDVVTLGASTDLAQLAVVLAGADAVVVGNTGPAHLAAAVGTPVVSLFAPTVPAVRWRPWRVPHVLLGDQTIACAGCRARVCPVPGHPCLGGLAVAEVLAAVDRLAPRPVLEMEEVASP